MKNQKFDQGSTVYSEFGQSAEYVAQISEGHIVRPIVESCHGDEAYEHVCDPVTWRTVFVSPPVEKYNEELKVIHAKIDAANEVLKSVRTEYNQFNAAEKTRSTERAKIDALKYLDDFMDGKITHYAVFPAYGEPQILTLEQAVSDASSYNKKQRLLCLYGDMKTREIYWILHRYSDASGSNDCRTYPEKSLDDANELVRNEIASLLSKDDGARTYDTLRYVEWANTWGVTVPDKLQKIAESANQDNKKRAIADVQKNYANAVAELKRLGVEIPS